MTGASLSYPSSTSRLQGGRNVFEMGRRLLFAVSFTKLRLGEKRGHV